MKDRKVSRYLFMILCHKIRKCTIQSCEIKISFLQQEEYFQCGMVSNSFYPQTVFLRYRRDIQFENVKMHCAEEDK